MCSFSQKISPKGNILNGLWEIPNHYGGAGLSVN